MPKCILVIPCYNEAKRLNLDAFSMFLEQHADVDLLFVNDGSSDQTEHLLNEYVAQHSPSTVPDGGFVTDQVGRVGLLNLSPNGGKGHAVQKGICQAIKHADFVGYWDADLSTPLSEIDLFFQEFERFANLQIVIGSRVKIMGRRIIRKRSRHYVGRVFATFVSILLKTPFYDTQCGAKVFRRTAVVESLFKESFRSRWIFDVELLQRFLRHPDIAKAEDASILIHEVALNHWEDKAGSKLRLRDFVIAFVDLMRLYLRPGK